MTLIFIENMFGSGQVITVRESFDGCVLEHRLKPGENRRLAVSRFKSVVVHEEGDVALVARECLHNQPSMVNASQ